MSAQPENVVPDIAQPGNFVPDDFVPGHFVPDNVVPLRSPAVARPEPLPLGEILIEHGVLDRVRLDRALVLQAGLDLRLGELLVRRGEATRPEIEAALAIQFALPHVDLGRQPPDPALALGWDPGFCLANLCLPWRRNDGALVVAISDPQAIAAVRSARGAEGEALRFVIAAAPSIRAAAAGVFATALLARARSRPPLAMSCRAWARPSALAAAFMLIALATAILALGLPAALAALLVWAVLATLATTFLRGAALILSRKPAPAPAPEAGAAPLARFRPLPTVSILVPLYRETAVVGPLLAALARLDYPGELLDILLVCEGDDAPMLTALAGRPLPAAVRVLAVPPDRLRTKPRAMNYALDFCRGEIVGIYDAEDRPACDQLRHIALRFAACPPEVACLQARLGYYNARQNWLTRLFAAEYASWFEVLLPGYVRLGLPIPLGGTSVFFRRKALEAAGAWDAHNVTEDADLGMRLARFGWRTEMIDTTTLEEANGRVGPWIRQRSRWLKGYMATWITHMRNPVALWRDLGPRGFLAFQAILLGGITAYLALPLLWLGWALGAAGAVPTWVALLPGPLLPLFWGAMIAGQIVMLAVALRAVLRAGSAHLVPWLLLLPFYWPLGAIAAWRALWELALRPFHWHKTEHGFAPMPAEEAPARPAVPALSRAS